MPIVPDPEANTTTTAKQSDAPEVVTPAESAPPVAAAAVPETPDVAPTPTPPPSTETHEREEKTTTADPTEDATTTS